MTVLQKNKKLAAGIGVAAAAAAVLAVGAGTYASFVDTENVPQTTLAAGTLDLTVGGPSVVSSPATLNGLKPGQRVEVQYTVDNTGSVDGTLSLNFTTSGTDNGCAEPEADGTSVAAACNTATGNLVGLLEAQIPGVGSGKVVDHDTVPIALGALPAIDGPKTITVTFVVPQTAKNDIMTDTATINGVRTLTQAQAPAPAPAPN